VEKTKKQDVFKAIRDSLLEVDNKELNYSKLYKNVNEKLKLFRNKPSVTLSTRDFDSEIAILLEEGLLHRRTDDESKNKIKPVYFSLTKRAIKQHQFDVLGISREKQNLLKLYHLLFFYQALSPIRRIPKKQLDEILSSIPAQEKDLVIESHVHTVGTNFTQTIYKPVKYAHIQKTELSGVGPRGETAVSYYYRFLAFSEDEIMGYLKKSDNDRLVPFVNSIGFRKEEVEKQFRKAFSNLRQQHLIRPVEDIFGKIRFIFSDDILRDLIDKIWAIHEYELIILYRKMDYLEEPNTRERQWLERVFGKEEAGRMINRANLKRLSVSGEDKKVNEMDNIEYVNNLEGFKKYVSKKYGKVIEEYGFPTDLIEGICVGRVFD
jgi:hypothetical protein